MLDGKIRKTRTSKYQRCDSIEIRINNDIFQCVVFKTNWALPLQQNILYYIN